MKKGQIQRSIESNQTIKIWVHGKIDFVSRRIEIQIIFSISPLLVIFVTGAILQFASGNQLLFLGKLLHTVEMLPLSLGLLLLLFI